MDARVKPAHDVERPVDATLIVIDSDGELARALKLVDKLFSG